MNTPNHPALDEIEAIARRIRAAHPAPKGSAFPGRVGEDRDDRRVIVWDFSR